MRNAILSGIVVFCGLLIAQNSAWAVEMPRLSDAELQKLIQSIPAPPEKDSPQESADLNTILTIQSARTAGQCDVARLEAKPSLGQFFGKSEGPLNAAEIKKLEPLFIEVLTWIRPTLGKAKDYFQRPRPYVVNEKVTPCLDRDESFSYPSGHSVLATIVGRILSDWDPSRQYDFQSRVHSISKSRVIAGVHYPSDLAAGEDLGKKIYQRLKGTPGYSKWLAQF